MSGHVGQQLGNYRLLRLLGQGGFADVFLAEHVHLKTQAAIKVLHGRITSQDIQGFLNEAQTIAALKHPHIVRILDFGFEDMTPFLVMDYVPNGSVRERHPRGAILPTPMLLSYTRQIAAALQHAHTARIIHRDVKPENILLENDHTVVLSDFGIVTVAHSTSSLETQNIVGTVHYMSPEQLQGKPRSASDQYALGITVYEWLCGTRPFTGTSFTEVAMHQLLDAPPPLREKVPTISPPIEQVVMTALAKDPQQRFPSIQTFAEALEEACQIKKQKVFVAPISSSSRSVPLEETREQRRQMTSNPPSNVKDFQQSRQFQQTHFTSSSAPLSDTFPTDEQPTQSGSSMIQIVRKVTEGLPGIVGFGGFVYVIVDIVQASHGHSPPWWMWISSTIAFFGGITVYQSIEKLSPEQFLRFLKAIVDILFFTVTFIFLGSLIYFIVNIIQASLGYSPVWWVWVISISAMLLGVLFITLLAPLFTKGVKEKVSKS